MSEQDNKFSYKESVCLKEYFESKLNSMEKAMELAREIMNKRLEGMNEFREQINRIEGTFITRNELDLILDRINKDKSAFYAIIISIGALSLGVISLLLKML